MVLNAATCKEYESYVSGTEPPATWQVLSTTLTQKAPYAKAFDLTKPYPNPAPINGVNLAGIPHFAGMVRWEDWLANCACHALNIDVLSHAFGGSVYPSGSKLPKSYYHGPTSYTLPLPVGVHLRLKAGFGLACGTSCPQSQFIVTILKTHGVYFMDQGSAPGVLYLANYYNGTAWVQPWNLSDVTHIQTVPLSAFEVVPPPYCTRVSACVVSKEQQNCGPPFFDDIRVCRKER